MRTHLYACLFLQLYLHSFIHALFTHLSMGVSGCPGLKAQRSNRISSKLPSAIHPPPKKSVSADAFTRTRRHLELRTHTNACTRAITQTLTRALSRSHSQMRAPTHAYVRSRTRTSIRTHTTCRAGRCVFGVHELLLATSARTALVPSHTYTYTHTCTARAH